MSTNRKYSRKSFAAIAGLDYSLSRDRGKISIAIEKGSIIEHQNLIDISLSKNAEYLNKQILKIGQLQYDFHKNAMAIETARSIESLVTFVIKRNGPYSKEVYELRKLLIDKLDLSIAIQTKEQK